MPEFEFHPSPKTSENMRKIRGKDTAPEIAVRKVCCELGHSGYRLHRKDLPGKPDLAFMGRKTAIFVHGCFWHGHDCRLGSRKPKTNQSYWLPKIERTRRRDTENSMALQARGWCVLVVWECETKEKGALTQKILSFLNGPFP